MKIYRAQLSILQKRWYHFLAPRYWTMWFFLAVMRLLACLPFRPMLLVGAGLGWLFRVAVAKRRQVTATNLALCFPELSAAQRAQLLKANYRSAGIGIIETAWAWFASDRRIKKLLHINNLNDGVLTNKKNGLLIMACHYTHIELGIRMLSFITPLNIMYRPQNNLLFEWALQKARSRYVQKGIVRQDVRGLIRSLQNNEVVCYTIDQDVGREGSVFAPFFGVAANTVTGMSRFMRKTHSAAATGFFYHRDEKQQKYILNYYPALDNFPSDDDVADASRINALLEKAIRQHPEQYMWQHRRFKTRPPGEPRIY